MKNLHVRKRYSWVIAAAGLAFGALFATAAVPAGAQATSGTMTAQQAIHDLKANYGVMIIPRDGVDLNTLVSDSVVQRGSAAPSLAIARLANAMDARSRMVFIVVPATPDRPVTTLSDAQAFDNADAAVTLNLSGLPAGDAIRTVAAADNAAVDLRSDVGTRTVDMDLTNASVADAISRIAAATNTHWIQAYEIIPPPAPTMASAPQYHRNQPYMTVTTEDEGPTGPVYFHPAPPPPPPAAQPAPPATDQNNQTANGNSQNQAPAAQPAPVVPPYFVMQNGYAYDPFGNPYPQTWSGFSGGGYFPGSNLYLTPGYGGFFGGPPVVFGGTNSITF
jgi:hypothetical protein